MYAGIDVYRQELVVTLISRGFPKQLIGITVMVIHPFDDSPIPPRKLEKKVRLLSTEAAQVCRRVLEGAMSLSDWEAYALSVIQTYIDLAERYSSITHARAWERAYTRHEYETQITDNTSTDESVLMSGGHESKSVVLDSPITRDVETIVPLHSTDGLQGESTLKHEDGMLRPAAELEQKRLLDDMTGYIRTGMIAVITQAEGSVLNPEQIETKAEIFTGFAVLATIPLGLEWCDDPEANLIALIIRGEDWVSYILEYIPDAHGAMAATVTVACINWIAQALEGSGVAGAIDALPDWTPTIIRIRELSAGS